MLRGNAHAFIGLLALSALVSQVAGGGRPRGQDRRARQRDDARRAHSRSRRRRRVTRRDGAGQGLWLREPRARGPGHAGDDLPVGLGRQAVHGRRRDDAGRSGQARSRRAAVPLPAGCAADVAGYPRAAPAHAHVRDPGLHRRARRPAARLHGGRAAARCVHDAARFRSRCARGGTATRVTSCSAR